ncbi:hypothetical protein [Agreia sp. Leaf283]|uniref:hypothetical protein n=1 Tax=Agreia sp. Leaf283 TaxID=1736321 RepID=UPI0006F7E752|nr:hypothetical protein [Agreia sp. Leaf283]
MTVLSASGLVESVFLLISNHLTAGYEGVPEVSAMAIFTTAFYPVALTTVMVIAVVTSWGRRFEGPGGADLRTASDPDISGGDLSKISSARRGKHGFSRESVRRILTFAVPYRAKLVTFIALSVVGASLAVATPVLAGKWSTSSLRGARLTRSCGSPSVSRSWPWSWPTLSCHS